MALRGILTGKLAASGVLAVVPSLPNAPDWWPAMLPPLPVALVLGEQDSFTPNALWWAERLHAACVPVRVWTHSGGHEVPDHWPTVRAEALAWLAEAGA